MDYSNINFINVICNIIVTLIIISIYHNCFYCNKIEHMSGINDEAVAMIASLYNSNKLVVGELEVTGNITANGNVITNGDITTNGNITTSGNGTFGNAFIGSSIHENYAQFSHKNQTAADNYALIQHGTNGHTRLNSPLSGVVAIKNVQKFGFTDNENNVKYNSPMALTTKVTNNHKSMGNYVGLCGHTATCPNYVGYNLIPGQHGSPPPNAKMSIEKA